jgi:hypothetical protein
MLFDILMSGFLAREPMVLGSFEGFDRINPRDQQGSERFSCSSSKLGQGGERSLPHHSSSVSIQLQASFLRGRGGKVHFLRFSEGWAHQLRRRDSIWLREARSTVELLPDVNV